MKVAIVDDDPSEVELIVKVVSTLGHECHGFHRGRALLRQMRRDTFDFLILDWHLPDMNGPEIVVWVRNKIEHRIPILFVTNRGQEQDLINALACGADDYLVKPVRVGELTARVSALMRRTYPASVGDVETYGCYTFDTRKRTVTISGQVVELKQKEYELAHFLFGNVGRLMSRKHLLDKVWGLDPEIWSRSLDTHISSLRRKLNLNVSSGYRLSAVYGVGYRLEAMARSVGNESERRPGSNARSEE